MQAISRHRKKVVADNHHIGKISSVQQKREMKSVLGNLLRTRMRHWSPGWGRKAQVGGKNLSERQGKQPLPLLLCLSIIISNLCFDDLTIDFTGKTKKMNH